MYLRKESVAGAYFPAFLCAEIDTNTPLNLIGNFPLDSKTEALFLHEYIHYLQDITTIGGMPAISAVANRIRWASSKVKGKRIEVPIDLSKQKAFFLDVNMLHQRIADGYGKIDSDSNRIIISKFVSFELGNNTYNLGKNIPSHIADDAIFTFKDQSNNTYKYKVGAFAISECQAFLIEQYIYPNVIPADTANDCPYRVVQKIVENECPEYNDPISMVALCDAAMSFSFPGKYLYLLIQELKTLTKKLLPSEIIGLGMSNQMLKKAGSNYSFYQSLEKACLNTSSEITKYFSASYYQGNRTFCEQYFEIAKQFRISRPLFMIDIMLGGVLFRNDTFKSTLNYLGFTAIYTNNDFVNLIPIWYQGVRPESEVFVALHVMHDILFTHYLDKNHGTMLCPLINWCPINFKANNVPNYTKHPDADCKHFPWTHKDVFLLLGKCPVATLFASYGFQGKKFVKHPDTKEDIIF